MLNLRGDDVPYNPVFLSYMLIRENEIFLYASPEIFNIEIMNALNNDGVNIKAYNDIYNDLKAVSRGEAVLVDKASANYMILASDPERLKRDLAAIGVKDGNHLFIREKSTTPPKC